mmetsp:Transcript_20215/g.68618  ORF Transcript_20215/g.68618 Transcript_20215/m.68618 type:complete len:224 (-) Transcript_20215:191-862(-)
MAALMASSSAGVRRRAVRSTTDTSAVGTRKAMPVSLPLRAGITLPTALAAPVDAGMMLSLAVRPARQSLPPLLGPSTVSWLAVMACTVVMRPSSMPKASSITLARGARQLVVQLALDTTGMLGSYASWFTPMTNMGHASLGGAEMITWRAPPAMCAEAFSWVVNTPVDSHTKAAPDSPHGMEAGSLSAKTRTVWPSMMRQFSPTSTVPLKRPWNESYLNRYAM